MSILKRNTQIPPPSQTDKAFYAKKCQIWAKNGPNIGPHFLGGGWGGVGWGGGGGGGGGGVS